MGYLSDILAVTAIIVSVICACIAYKQSNKQFVVSLQQNEIGNQMALIDKRIELYLFLKSIQEKLDSLYAKEFDASEVRQNKIHAASYILYYIFGMDLFYDVDVDFRDMNDHDAADLQAVLSRLDRYSFFAEVFWKNDAARKFVEKYKGLCRDVIYSSACDSEKAKMYSYVRHQGVNLEKNVAKGDALDAIIIEIRELKKMLDALPLEDLKKMPMN